MEVDERPTEQYSDIGGLDQQIQEVSLVISRFHKLISIRMITSNYGNQRERKKGNLTGQESYRHRKR